MTAALLLVLGIACAAVGGNLFVRGAVGLASWLRVPAGLIGATVAAFATSTPELSVGIQAATSGRPELALGDALGSNVVNITLVLGAVLLLGPVSATRRELRREITVAAVAPMMTLVALADGELGRGEAWVLLAVFGGWLFVLGREALHERSIAPQVIGERAGTRTVIELGLGLVMLVVAGRLIVVAAKGIGTELGLDPFVVGATFVAVGTSSPELATAIIARRRGHSEIGVGTVLGSNVFNTLWIVGVVALIRPVQTSASEVVLAVTATIGALALVVPARSGQVPRWRGAALMGVAVVYTAATIAIGG